MVKVKSIMSTNVATVEAAKTVLEAARLMNAKGFSGLVVVSGEKPVGVITARSILRRFVPRNVKPDAVKVSEIMYSPPLTVEADDDVKKAAKLIVQNKLTRVVVLRDGKLAGVVTLTDLAGRLTRKSLIEAITEKWRAQPTLTCPACGAAKLVKVEEWYGPILRCPQCSYILD